MVKLIIILRKSSDSQNSFIKTIRWRAACNTPGVIIFGQILLTKIRLARDNIFKKKVLSYQLPEEFICRFEDHEEATDKTLAAGQLILIAGGIQSGKTQALISLFKVLSSVNGELVAFIDGHYSLCPADFTRARLSEAQTAIVRPKNINEACKITQILVLNHGITHIILDGVFELPLPNEAFRGDPVFLRDKIEVVQQSCRHLLKLARQTQAIIVISSCNWGEHSQVSQEIAKYADRTFHLIKN